MARTGRKFHGARIANVLKGHATQIEIYKRCLYRHGFTDMRASTLKCIWKNLPSRCLPDECALSREGLTEYRSSLCTTCGSRLKINPNYNVSFVENDRQAAAFRFSLFFQYAIVVFLYRLRFSKQLFDASSFRLSTSVEKFSCDCK